MRRGLIEAGDPMPEPDGWVPFDPTNEEVIAEHPEAAVLQQRLLGIGGTRVKLGGPLIHFPDLLARGRVIPATGSRRQPMLPSECHSNAVTLWKGSKGRLSIATGYALSRDCWYRHSWVMAGERVVETTVRPDLYFGIDLNSGDAYGFALRNPPPHVRERSEEAAREGGPMLFAAELLTWALDTSRVNRSA